MEFKNDVKVNRGHLTAVNFTEYCKKTHTTVKHD